MKVVHVFKAGWLHSN